MPSNQYSKREREREREKLCFLGEFWQNGENLVFKVFFFKGAKLFFQKFKFPKKKFKKSTDSIFKSS